MEVDLAGRQHYPQPSERMHKRERFPTTPGPSEKRILKYRMKNGILLAISGIHTAEDRKIKIGRKTIMADNGEEKKVQEGDPYYCPDAPNNICIKGHMHGWRRSKECRLCQGTDAYPMDDE